MLLAPLVVLEGLAAGAQHLPVLVALAHQAKEIVVGLLGLAELLLAVAAGVQAQSVFLEHQLVMVAMAFLRHILVLLFFMLAEGEAVAMAVISVRGAMEAVVVVGQM